MLKNVVCVSACVLPATQQMAGEHVFERITECFFENIVQLRCRSAGFFSPLFSSLFFCLTLFFTPFDGVMSCEFRSWVGGNAGWWIRRIVRGVHNQTTVLLHKGSIYGRNLNLIGRFFLSCGRQIYIVDSTNGHTKKWVFVFGERTACQIPIESRLILETTYARCVFESKTVGPTTNAAGKIGRREDGRRIEKVYRRVERLLDDRRLLGTPRICAESEHKKRQ